MSIVMALSSFELWSRPIPHATFLETHMLGLECRLLRYVSGFTPPQRNLSLSRALWYYHECPLISLYRLPG